MSSKKTSEIWTHFEELEGNKVKCGYCKQIIKFSNRSTGNLIRHMKTKHMGVPLHRNNRETETSREAEGHEGNISPKISGERPQQENSEQNLQTGDLGKSQNQTRPVQQSLNDFVRSNKPVPIKKSKEFDQQLVKMIVKEYYPFRIVEDKEFKKFIQMLCPGYNLPSRKTISESLNLKVKRKA